MWGDQPGDEGAHLAHSPPSSLAPLVVMGSFSLPGSSRACCMHRQGLRRDERPDVTPNPETQRWIYVGMEKPTRVDHRVRVAESRPGWLASEGGITEGSWRVRYPNQNPELPPESYVILGELVPLRASVSSSIKWD